MIRILVLIVIAGIGLAVYFANQPMMRPTAGLVGDSGLSQLSESSKDFGNLTSSLKDSGRGPASVEMESLMEEAIVEPAPTAPSTTSSAPTTASVKTALPRASRIFGAESQFPPEQYLAYGILAFDGRPTAQTGERYHMICESFLQKIPHSTELPDTPKSNQIVTVWPMEDVVDAIKANAARREDTCAIAVERYGVALAQKRLAEARLARPKDLPATRGPFLIAWNPTDRVGMPDEPILVHDLSYVRTTVQADDAMRRWMLEIQAGPPQWGSPIGWERFRLNVRNKLDYWGPNGTQILTRVLGDAKKP